ncbi:hypothetical protein DFP73DRAFT_592813 [Morchella snyderi]|nr:hypothetical protein DFP73DRAFT_592813 [Morchella snyderi]
MRSKKSDHVSGTAVESHSKSMLPAVLPVEVIVIESDSESDELDDLEDLYHTPPESVDGDKEGVARVEGDSDKKADTSNSGDDGVPISARLETIEHAEIQAALAPAAAATDAPRDANAPADADTDADTDTDTDADTDADTDVDLDADTDPDPGAVIKAAESPAAPAPEGRTPQEAFNALFSKSPADQKIGAKSLPGLRGRAAFGDTLQAGRKRQFMAAASKSVPIKRLFRRQVERATKLAAAAVARVENVGEEEKEDLPEDSLQPGDGLRLVGGGELHHYADENEFLLQRGNFVISPASFSEHTLYRKSGLLPSIYSEVAASIIVLAAVQTLFTIFQKALNELEHDYRNPAI